jgi:hypothetical protein
MQSLTTTIHNIYEQNYSEMEFNRNVNINNILFADDQVLLAKSEDDLTQFEQNSIRIFHGVKRGEN